MNPLRGQNNVQGMADWVVSHVRGRVNSPLKTLTVLPITKSMIKLLKAQWLI
ncbi:MAG: hypothetical protein QNK36_12120 [Colwellia sp.]|nr:hypothetical protein [Colwellia sp.]